MEDLLRGGFSRIEYRHRIGQSDAIFHQNREGIPPLHFGKDGGKGLVVGRETLFAPRHYLLDIRRRDGFGFGA